MEERVHKYSTVRTKSCAPLAYHNKQTLWLGSTTGYRSHTPSTTPFHYPRNQMGECAQISQILNRCRYGNHDLRLRSDKKRLYHFFFVFWLSSKAFLSRHGYIEYGFEGKENGGMVTTLSLSFFAHLSVSRLLWGSCYYHPSSRSFKSNV